MKFAIKARDLAGPAAMVAKIGETRNTNPILAHTLIHADGGTVSLLGHTLDRCLSSTVEGEVSEPGATTVDAKRFAKLLAAIDGEMQVKFSTDEKGAVLQSGRSRYRFDSLVADEFPVPLMPEQRVEEGREPLQLAEMMLDNDARHQLFEMTQFAISTEETRYYLNGVYLTGSDGKALGVATDGHRLARNFATVAITGSWPAIIVPRPAVDSIVALEVDRLVTEGRILQAIAPGIVFASKLIDGTFPAWERVVPQVSRNSVEFDVDEMLGALRRMQAVSSKEDTQKRGGVCKLEWAAGADTLRLSLKADAAEDVIAATVGEREGEFACSIHYLKEALENLDAKRVFVDSEDARSPVRITAPGSDDILGILMPIRW